MDRPGLLSLATIGSDLATDLAGDLAGADVLTMLSEKTVDMASRAGHSPDRMEFLSSMAATQRLQVDSMQQVESVSMQQRGEIPGGRTLVHDVVTAPKNDLSHLQLNLLKDQVSNLAREISAARQDINTLRLADTQYEMVNAEMSRHVREFQAQLRGDIQGQAAQFQELAAQVELSVSNAMKQSTMALQGADELRKTTARDFELVEKRAVKTSASFVEENFASLDQLQRITQLLEQKAEKFDLDEQIGTANQAIDDLAQQMDSTVSDLRGLSAKHEALTLTVQTLEDSMNTSLKALEESTAAALGSTNEAMRSQVTHLASELSELVSNVTVQEEMMRKQMGSEYTSQMATSISNLDKLQNELANHKSNLEQVSSDYKTHIASHSAAVEKAHGAMHERIDEMHKQSANRMQKELARLSEEHDAKHTGARS